MNLRVNVKNLTLSLVLMHIKLTSTCLPAMKILMRKKTDDAYNTIKNCKIEYADGCALIMNGNNNTVENNLIHDIDYSCLTGGYTINMVNSKKAKFYRKAVLVMCVLSNNLKYFLGSLS